MADLADFPLDALAQHARINRLYTQITLCFPFPEATQELHNSIVDSLTRGLEELSTTFPWISGTVLKQDAKFKVVPSEQTTELRVRGPEDATGLHDWETLQQANFPFSMLDESVVAARSTLATEKDLEDGLPVFIAQANFVTGGFLLTLQGQHGAMDMAGLAHVMYLYARACRGEMFTSEEIKVGNIKRDEINLLLSDQEFGEATKASAERSDRHSPKCTPVDIQPVTDLTWAYFAFSESTLERLKTQAMQHVSSGSFVSTDDVLSVYIWRAATRARLARLSHTDGVTTTLSRNADVRKALGVSPTYCGLLVTSTEHTCTTDTFLDESPGSLGPLASELRGSLGSEGLVAKTRLAASRIARGESAPSLKAGRPELDVRLSSWAKEHCYDLDFGFGKPVAVRRPAFEDGAREGLVYFLPANPSGNIVVGICLGSDDIGRLRNLECMKTDTTYIG